MSSLPAGLAETIEHFRRGCEARQKPISPDVAREMTVRFGPSYAEHADSWLRVSPKLLTLARMAGRLAGLYADLAGSPTVEWRHAETALSDLRAESKTRYIGRYFAGVDLTREPPADPVTAAARRNSAKGGRPRRRASA
jgi:hypothetical protein